ncbi:MAG: YceD family protein [Saccharofermentanales bacterium]
MRIDIKTIARDIGSSMDISLKLSPKSLDLLQEDYKIAEIITFEGELKNVADKVLILTGKLTGSLSTCCDRCGEPTRLDFEGLVEATFRSEAEVKAQELSADPEEDYTYEGFSIIPDKALRDSLLLCLPIKILCGEECKGLCVVCGNNLNVDDCGCAESGKNRISAFDDLKKLL